jgi:methionyl-tRNA synthetase
MTISFEDFQKLELRIAEVKEVTDHPNADKLYVLKVDAGGEERQLVAGLKPHIPPEKLLGKKIVIVANLQPATLRGIESHGMLLAAQHEEHVTIIVPDEDLPPGAIVS